MGATQAIGIRDAVWICLGVAVFGLIGGLVLYLGGRPRLEVPDLERWQGGPGEPAWSSPPLFAAMRKPPPSEESAQPRPEPVTTR